ncbi:hypothetical protein WN51_03841 [Melipona quadrifasciata]|uniref:Uncharacterized protein n=1 Tax=Melipona quadrifasciata TaxID=166423 RepID=A0A0M9AD97_9HYME|nr:hypothetical protein WN51_03841 [Melipona quadrifasciata]
MRTLHAVGYALELQSASSASMSSNRAANVHSWKSGDSKEDEKQIIVSENRCSCCLRPFFLERGVRCEDCGRKSCRKGCSRWDPSDNAWRCLFCRQRRYWLKKNGVETFGELTDEKDLHRYFDTAKSRVYVAGVENAATSSGEGLAAQRKEANTMETVRDFVEKIVVGLIGNLDDTPIHRLYDHPSYDKLLERHIAPLVDALSRLAMALQFSLENKPSTDSPTMAHTALREIVERAVEEVRKLPGLGGSGGTGKAPEARNVAENSYEDILATAILNKVIEKFQKEQVDGNSNVLPGKPVSTKCALSESEAGLDEGVEEGCSSLEPLSQDDCSSDCSASCSRRVRNQPEPLSLTTEPSRMKRENECRNSLIEERIEEVTTYASDEDHRENDVLPIKNAHRVPFPELGMDIIDPSQESDSQDEPDTPRTHIGLVSPIESWEENWLFQKKRVQTQADPVAMLVPNPSADFKALIGDKDAEDTSDLSECSSAQSDEEIEKELMEAINNVVPRSPREKEFENDLGYSNSNEEKTDWRKLEEEKEEGYKQNRSVERNEEVEEEQVKRKLERVETVPESRNLIGNGLTKAEMERRTTNLDLLSKEDKRDSINDEVKGNELDSLSNSVNSKSFTVIASDEDALDVPKTPTPTPTRISMLEINLENPRNGETYISQEKIVLKSLECAKKKLMAVNDDIAEVFEDEEAISAQRKVDFHAEDIQQESEYTEHYDIATQRHLDSLTKSESLESTPLTNSSLENNESKCREAVAFAKAESASHLSLQSKDPEAEDRLGTPPRPGTIAEREHRKWENAPPIENNPYSQENIQKRLWERQYSRRSSDIPGIHTELPKSNGADLDVVLTPHEPDIKRFGRDYYINDSRSSGNEKRRRSAVSSSSRPSSSLSQRSSSNGIADQDQQVSFQLEKFEEASLRGSLSRWTYRDPCSSSQFAINPLLLMELDVSTEPSDRDHEKIDRSNETFLRSDIPDGVEHKDDILKLTSDELSRKVAYNPLYELEKNQRSDHDSGTFSVDTSHAEDKKQDEDRWRRLWIDDDQERSSTRNEQILSLNGKRYWTLNGCKYYTFGGIKNSFGKNVEEDSDEDYLKVEARDEPFDIADFGKFKFQTFGGIKKSKRIDGKGIPMYRRVTLRMRSSYKKAQGMRWTHSDSVLYKLGSDENVDRQSDWQSDYESDSTEEKDKTKYLDVSKKKKCNDKLYKRQTKAVYCSSRRSSSSDESWQDEDEQSTYKMTIRKFLRDTSSRKVKSRSNSDNNSNYFLNTSRRKVFDGSLRRSRYQKRSSDNNESLKLEPPIVPEVVETTFETLRDLRGKGKKKKRESSKSSERKKIGVRSLTDLTICFNTVVRLAIASSNCGVIVEEQLVRPEETQYEETEIILNRSNDVKSKVTKWQNNNVENNYQQPVRQQSDPSDETEKDRGKFAMIESQKSWEDQRMEEILENERKNSKNEINAKLNNQENYENVVMETKKSANPVDVNPRKIKRIDLKAYGFENEFFSSKTIRTSAPRVVNKLDLKSFGYDNGIRRTQSNIQLNSIGSDEFKASNRASGENNLTQSTETLNKFENGNYNDYGLKSAKSVPNIAKFYSNSNDQEDEEVESYSRNSYDFGVIKNGSVRNIASNYGLEKYNVKSNDSSSDVSENETDNSSEREQSRRSMNDVKKKILSDEEFDNKVLPMPSVRRLAEAFSKQTEPVSAPISKVTKSSNVNKERSSTPEIQIVETPRQMHSLTARSLSKQFREGLRQIPNKVTSPPASHVVMEQPNLTENQMEVVQAKSDLSNDTNVILPGKLKSNIIFWEQMQKKS